MALNLLDSFGVKGVNYGLYTKQADVIDTEYLSRYFVVSEFNSTLTAGKNPIAINGSPFLEQNSEIFIECLDAQGSNLFIEMATYSDDSTIGNTYKEGTATIVAVHVYGDTADGVGRLIIYGTLVDGRSVKWMQNVVINKTLTNHSRVRFYQNPTLEITSADLPVLSSDISQNLVSNQIFEGTIGGLAVTPIKNTTQTTINKANIDIDYRLTLTNPLAVNSTPTTASFNSQMVGATITLNINTIQSPASLTQIPVSLTSSYAIINVLNNNTVQIDRPFYYLDGVGNNSVTNIIAADFSIEYPFINYNNSSSTYQTTTVNGVTYVIKDSYADVSYKNIRTFSGYVARHKIYRKSLLSNADFSVIADEPIYPNQVLIDDLTQNKYYDLLGKFYNQQHINRYWFTSSNNIGLVHTPSYAIDSMYVSTVTPPSGTDYFIVKNDSVPINRDAVYVPFDMDEYLEESGSSYDSNFMAFKSNVQYTINISSVIQKVQTEMGAKLSLYITSSYPGASKEHNYTPNYGVKIAEIVANQSGSTVDFTDSYAFYTPQNDFYGTLVVVPTLCSTYIKGIAISVYGDSGFSPDIYSTKIPWPISVANETYQIRSELFDINSNLIYSNLNAFQSFDPSGSTLIPFIPSGGGSGSYTSGSLFISGSLYVSQSIYTPNIVARSGANPALSQSRIVSVRADGALVFDPIVDIDGDDEYLYLSLGNASNRLATTITTRKSLASEYDSLAGRKIYWVTGSKITETSP